MKLLFITVFLAIVSTLSAADTKPPFTLAIVPTSSNEDGRSISTTAKEPHLFYAVLTNVSDQTQATWQTWNSWGIRTISFEFTMSDGKHISVSKRNQIFTRNFPSTFLIPAREQEVYPIRLDAEWDNRSILAESGDKPVTVKAIYQVSPTLESAKYKVWTGRVESRNYSFVVDHR